MGVDLSQRRRQLSQDGVEEALIEAIDDLLTMFDCMVDDFRMPVGFGIQYFVA